MAKQIINVGARNNDGTGDSLRVGATKVNDNFSEIYNLLGNGETLSVVSSINAGQGLAVSNTTGAVLITGRIASANDIGLVKVGENLTISQDGTLSAQQTEYALPTASSTVLGGVKVGSGLTISQGVLSATAQTYTLPTATTSLLGGVKVDGTSVTIANGVISSASYVLPTASGTTLGGVKVDGQTITISQGIISAVGNTVTDRLVNGENEAILGSNGTLTASGLYTTGDLGFNGGVVGALGQGVGVGIYGADPTVSTPGGSVHLQAGASYAEFNGPTTPGGSVVISAGQGSNEVNASVGGGVQIYAGAAAVTAGDIRIEAGGTYGSSGQGGDILIQSGSSLTGVAGDIEIRSGVGTEGMQIFEGSLKLRGSTVEVASSFESFKIKTGDVDFNDPEGPFTWEFDNVGVLTLPASGSIAGPSGINIVSQNGNQMQLLYNRGTAVNPDPTYNANVSALFLDGSGANIEVVTDDSSKVWQFGTSGHVTFPDGSVQVTAYTGTGDDNIWIETFASDAPSADFVQGATSVEYDADGNVIALFSHYVPGDPEISYTSVAKLTPTGAVLWQVRFGANLYSDGWGLAYDTMDNVVYVAGRTSGTPLTYEFATLTKLNGTFGDIIWSKTYDFEANSTSAVVDVDSDGNPVMVGYSYNGTDTYIVTSKINKTDGSVLWSKTLDGQGYDEAYGMAVGPSNEIVTIGYTDTYGVQNAVATVYADPANNANWTMSTNVPGPVFSCDITFPSPGNPVFSNIVDTAGNRAVDGILATVLGSVLGGEDGVDDMIIKVATLATNDTNDRMVVIKYATDGTIAWQKAVQFDAGYDCRGADADIDSAGNIYVCGSYQYDYQTYTTSAMSLVKFNSSGVKQWSRRVVGNCDTFGTSVVVGDDDQLYLSGVTGTDNTDDYTWVVAKYNTDGVVTWQRLIDNTTTWTFGGSFWFGGGGGSNIAVKNGYVALAGAFGDPGTQPIAVVLQIDTAATPFSVGNWDFKGASFSGLLNGSASDITVVDANKPVATVSPAVGTFAINEDLSNFLTITRYGLGSVGTGDVTFNQNTIIGTGDAYGGNGLNLSPGPGLAADMYFRVHGGDNPTHLHLSVGNTSLYDQYFGTDGKYLKLGDNDVVSIGTNGNAWLFDTDGTTILPGAVASGTAAKTGVLGAPGSGQVATVTLGSTNNTNFTPGVYPGLGIGVGTGYTLTLTVAGNGDLTVEVTASGTGFFVGDQANLLGAAIAGGSSPADDIVLTVATLSNIVVATALDLTKSVNKLTTGYYTLANGLEGQVMHLVRQTGATVSITVIVANARVAGAQYTTIEHYPFTTGDMNMLIFTDGAWQAMGGTWD